MLNVSISGAVEQKRNKCSAIFRRRENGILRHNRMIIDITSQKNAAKCVKKIGDFEVAKSAVCIRANKRNKRSVMAMRERVEEDGMVNPRKVSILL